ncbi:hypothetical protein BHE74_00025378, partial [Ensete ventricosum]
MQIIVKECHNEEAQCAFVVDKILEITSDGQNADCSFGNVAILYRRQVSGRAFQMCFRNRKIPFNSHGVAFYRKKVYACPPIPNAVAFYCFLTSL